MTRLLLTIAIVLAIAAPAVAQTTSGDDPHVNPCAQHGPGLITVWADGEPVACEHAPPTPKVTTQGYCAEDGQPGFANADGTCTTPTEYANLYADPATVVVQTRSVPPATNDAVTVADLYESIATRLRAEGRLH